MARLTIERQACTNSLDTMKITGLTNEELSELKSMEHYESKEKLLDILDNRNDGQGTLWAIGNGVYGLWYDNDAAYLNVGRSCD